MDRTERRYRRRLRTCDDGAGRLHLHRAGCGPLPQCIGHGNGKRIEPPERWNEWDPRNLFQWCWCCIGLTLGRDPCRRRNLERSKCHDGELRSRHHGTGRVYLYRCRFGIMRRCYGHCDGNGERVAQRRFQRHIGSMQQWSKCCVERLVGRITTSWWNVERTKRCRWRQLRSSNDGRWCVHLHGERHSTLHECHGHSDRNGERSAERRLQRHIGCMQ